MRAEWVEPTATHSSVLSPTPTLLPRRRLLPEHRQRHPDQPLDFLGAGLGQDPFAPGPLSGGELVEQPPQEADQRHPLPLDRAVDGDEDSPTRCCSRSKR